MSEPKPIRMTGLHTLIQPLPKAKKSPGGVHLLEQFNDDERQWRVLAVGPGRWCRNKKKQLVFIAPEISVGDRVLCDITSGGHALEDGCWIVDARQCEMKW